MGASILLAVITERLSPMKHPKKSPTRMTATSKSSHKTRLTKAEQLLGARQARKPNKALRKLMEHTPVWQIARAAAAENDRLVQQSGAKASNPKDVLGIRKVPYSTISQPVLAEVGVAMLEGALKYGRHNYRAIGVRASVYFDAEAARHMALWWEGEDIDPDSDMSHITKAIASLCVLRDAMIQGKMIDDRPPKSPPGWQNELNRKVAALIAKYPNPVPPYIEGDVRMK